MRRSIGLIALLAVLAASGLPLRAAGRSPMACCRGGAAMACCLPGPGCAMKSCPPAEGAAADLPGLPPAVVETASSASVPVPAIEAVFSFDGSPRTRVSPPPRRPPRA